MLMQTGVTDSTGVSTNAIILFPAWPCDDWAVHFKLHAPGNTVVEGVYDGAGKVSKFTVTPESRKSDVVFAGCVLHADDVDWRHS